MFFKKSFMVMVALVSVFTLLCTTFCFANESGYNPETCNVLVKGTIPQGQYTENSTVSVMLINSLKSVGFFDTFPVDEAGNYNAKFKFTGNINEYTLRVKAGDSDVTDTVNVMTVDANPRIVEVKVKSDDGTYSIKESGKIVGSVCIENPYWDEMYCKLIAAEYDAELKLIDTNIIDELYIPYNIEGNGRITNHSIDYSVKSENTDTVKFFAWTDMVTMVPLGDKVEISETKYGVDNLTDEAGELKIAFLGGSITEGAASSSNAKTSFAALVTDYYENKFPNRTVTSYNAGIGGTNSRLGAVRAYRDIIPYEPDVVFIEYGVNDAGGDHAETKKSMETIVRSLLRLQKVPAIVFLYSFRDPSTTKEYGSVMHKEVAEYYGIGEIDFKSYVENELIGAGKKYATADEAMSELMNDSVHPLDSGHKLYADYITQCLEENPELYYAKLEYKEKNFNAFDTDLEFINWDDESVTLSDGWETVEHENSGYKAVAFRYPRFDKGLKKAVGGGHTITVNFEGDVFGIYCHGISKGNNLTYSIDNGVKTGRFQTINIYDNYQTVQSYVSGLGEGSHTITITTNEPSTVTKSNKDYFVDTVELVGFFVEK